TPYAAGGAVKRGLLNRSGDLLAHCHNFAEFLSYGCAASHATNPRVTSASIFKRSSSPPRSTKESGPPNRDNQLTAILMIASVACSVSTYARACLQSITTRAL